MLKENICLKSNPNQISGARFIFIDKDGNICKPANEVETKFYKEILAGPLVNIVPRFYNSFSLRKDIDQIEIQKSDSTTYTKLVKRWTGDKFENEYLNGHEYITLENVSKSMMKPCFIDIKLQQKPYNTVKVER